MITYGKWLDDFDNINEFINTMKNEQNQYKQDILKIQDELGKLQEEFLMSSDSILRSIISDKFSRICLKYDLPKKDYRKNKERIYIDKEKGIYVKNPEEFFNKDNVYYKIEQEYKPIPLEPRIIDMSFPNPINVILDYFFPTCVCCNKRKIRTKIKLFNENICNECSFVFDIDTQDKVKIVMDVRNKVEKEVKNNLGGLL